LKLSQFAENTSVEPRISRFGDLILMAIAASKLLRGIVSVGPTGKHFREVGEELDRAIMYALGGPQGDMEQASAILKEIEELVRESVASEKSVLKHKRRPPKGSADVS